MGGFGSGGHNRVSDEEKRRRGTYRADRSEAVYGERRTALVVSGPWLSAIPEPVVTLKDIGRRFYDDITRQLLDQNKLTRLTQLAAERLAQSYERRVVLSEQGKYPTATDDAQFDRAMKALQIAENAPKITKPDAQQNRFARNGFSNRRAQAG
jgi:hypothetical protein